MRFSIKIAVNNGEGEGVSGWELSGGEWCGSPKQQSRKGGKLGGNMRTLKRKN
jgi:hypothetical protein